MSHDPHTAPTPGPFPSVRTEDLQGGSGTNRNRWYTDTFNGTSSAGPIVAGSVACIQGALKAAGKSPLTSQQMRTLLRSNGAAQVGDPTRPTSQRIGPLPDLAQAIPAALALQGGNVGARSLRVGRLFAMAT